MPEESDAVAVVVAHGIGNQLPMDTVRSLVDNVFGAMSGEPHPAPVYSRLQRGARVSDLRRLALAPSAERPRVDFYELYWQAAFGKGDTGAVLGWALRLLRRAPVGDQFRRVVRTVRVVLVLVLGLTAVGAAAYASRDPHGWLARTLIVVGPVLAAVLVLAKVAVGNLLATVVADASRYFAPGPDDVGRRDDVRALGVDLLRQLHRSEDGSPRYGRIVVIGHSLGSVVAYDAIRLAFDELRRPADTGPLQGGVLQRQPHAWAFATAQPGHPPIVDPAGQPVLAETGGVAYQEQQSALHAEQRAMGVPWRVTDFVTVGSPLTHARDLLAGRDVDLGRRMLENELPGCPPLGEQQHREQDWAKSSGPGSVPLAAGAEGTGRLAFYRRDVGGPLIAHEASPFATTRWTNLYIPMTWWLGGDPVGGPVAEVFGRGVVDIEVEVSAPRTGRRAAMMLPVKAHTLYWRREGHGSEDADRDCIEQLRRAMRLRWSG